MKRALLSVTALGMILGGGIAHVKSDQSALQAERLKAEIEKSNHNRKVWLLNKKISNFSRERK